MDNQEQTSQKRKIGIGNILLVLILLGAGALGSYLYFSDKLPQKTIVPEVTQEQEDTEGEFSVNLTVNDGTEETGFVMQSFAGDNAFDSVKRLDELSDKFSFEYSESDFGAFVTSVNGVSPDPNTEFWKITVNGEDAQVGVSDLVLKNGDTIGFEIEEIIF
jgi:hypothetical protein